MSDKLPYFKQPPVIEVVIGVQFEPIFPFPLAAFAKFPELFSSNYPVVEEHLPLEPSFENLHDDNFVMPVYGFQFPQPTNLPRLWMLEETRHKLLQFQSDRFVFNWRKSNEKQEKQEYPRFHILRDEYQNHYRVFQKFMEGNHLQLVPNQVEVSYINVIECGNVDFTRAMHKIFKFWSEDQGKSPLGEPENQSFIMTYKIMDDQGMYGRVNVSTRTGITAQGKFLQVTLSAKGAPRDNSEKGLFDFINLSHEKIVNGFDYLTTEDMHKQWGKE